MEVSEVVVKLANPQPASDGLVAYVNLVLDGCLAVKDIRLIRVHHRYIVCMPSKDKTERCPKCNAKNSLVHKFCHGCGEKRERNIDGEMRDSLRVDQVHPINSAFRAYLEDKVVAEYGKERAGYRG